jgi:DNA-binding PadR family transcriptional regulator
MPQNPPKWFHPQAVPRGFLRLYILTKLSKGPQSGYSIMRDIEDKTEGAWRPGPGTIYPLLKSLSKEGMVKVSSDDEKSPGKSYSLTPKGRRSLDDMLGNIGAIGRKEGVLARLFSEVLPPKTFVNLVVRRYGEGSAVLREKIRAIPPRDRAVILDEYKLLLESQLAWVAAQLREAEAV